MDNKFGRGRSSESKRYEEPKVGMKVNWGSYQHNPINWPIIQEFKKTYGTGPFVVASVEKDLEGKNRYQSFMVTLKKNGVPIYEPRINKEPLKVLKLVWHYFEVIK